MAIIRKSLAREKYTKIDNMVACNQNITDYALRLYVYMAGFKNGFQLNDAYIDKALSWSRSKTTRAKRELKNNDLICVEKIDRSTYFLYIGNSFEPATYVRDNWKQLESEMDFVNKKGK